jgi:hypothetical protein
MALGAAGRDGLSRPSSTASLGAAAAAAGPRGASEPAASEMGPPASTMGGDEAQGGGDGDKTPEGDRTSSSDDEAGDAKGPVLDIWGNEVRQERACVRVCVARAYGAGPALV